MLKPDASQLQFTADTNSEHNKYKIFFEAKTDKNGTVLHFESWGGKGWMNQSLTENWKVYESTFVPDAKYHNIYFWNTGQGNNGQISLRNVHLYQLPS